jgi:ATP-dependent helicase YprA (DUF1998 family)
MLRLNPVANLTQAAICSSAEDVMEYSLRLAMGNSDLEPLHQVNLIVPASLQPAMARLCEASTCSGTIPVLMSSETLFAGVASTDFHVLSSVLSVLCHHGLCTLHK